MKDLPSFDRVNAAIEYDAETGMFRRRVYLGGKVHADWTAGSEHNGYLRIHVCGRQHLAHRIAWLLVTGAWPESEIDHIDGFKANNRWSNLRAATRAMNCQNLRRGREGSSTGVLGVAYDPRYRRPYVARIRATGKVVAIGRFATVEQAREAYLQAKRALHPGYVETAA